MYSIIYFKNELVTHLNILGARFILQLHSFEMQKYETCTYFLHFTRLYILKTFSLKILQKVQIGMCANWRLKSVCASAVWSESSIGALWVTKNPMFLQVEN